MERKIVDLPAIEVGEVSIQALGLALRRRQYRRTTIHSDSTISASSLGHIVHRRH